MKYRPSILIVIRGLYFLSLLALGQGLSPCNKKEPPYLKFRTSEIVIPSSAGAELIVESNVLSRISVFPSGTDWLEIDRSSGLGEGTIHITTLTQSSFFESRRATVVAMCTDMSLPFVAQAAVTQNPIPEFRF